MATSLTKDAYSFPPTTASITTYHTPLLDQPTWRTGNPDLDRVEEIRKAALLESGRKPVEYCRLLPADGQERECVFVFGWPKAT